MEPIASISLVQLPMTKDSGFPTQQGVNECEKWLNKQSTADQEEDSWFFHRYHLCCLLFHLSSLDLVLIYWKKMSTHVWGTLLFSNFFVLLSLWLFSSLKSAPLSFSFLLCYCAVALCAFVKQAREIDTPLQQSGAYWIEPVALIISLLVHSTGWCWWTQPRSWHFPALWLRDKGRMLVSVQV